MSASLNRAEIIGNVGKDPEVRSFPDGNKIASFSVATSESWKDKSSGEKKERTEWHHISVFGKLADIAEEYVRKGSKVYVSGQLQTRKWTAQDGSDRYTTEIVIRGFGAKLLLLGGRGDASSGAPPPRDDQRQTESGFDTLPSGEMNDDIPF